MQNRQKRPKRIRFKLRPLNLGCLTLALLVGLTIGLRGSQNVLPQWLNWVIAGLFVVFFAVLSFVMTGIATRRDETVRQENMLLDSGGLLRSLKTFIVLNNPPAQLSINALSAFDQDMAILDEFAARLELRQELSQAESHTLNNIATHWLTSDQLEEWYRQSKTVNS